MHDYAVLARGPFRPHQLQISYAPGAGRIARADERPEIDRIWRETLSQTRRMGLPLYDGRLFRLMSFELLPGHLSLRLGDTTYKEYVATRAPELCRARSESELAQPLAVCAAVVTRDDRLLVERRQRSEVGRGRYHVIGGFLERDKDLGPDGPSPFRAMAREIREETALEIDPRDLLVLGLIRDLRTPHPELCLTVSSPVSFDRIVQGLPRDGEILQIESVGADRAALGTFLLENQDNLTPSGRACLELYGAWRHGDDWKTRRHARD